jgi:hypothetical protein
MLGFFDNTVGFRSIRVLQNATFALRAGNSCWSRAFWKCAAVTTTEHFRTDTREQALNIQLPLVTLLPQVKSLGCLLVQPP